LLFGFAAGTLLGLAAGTLLGFAAGTLLGFAACLLFGFAAGTLFGFATCLLFGVAAGSLFGFPTCGLLLGFAARSLLLRFPAGAVFGLAFERLDRGLWSGGRRFDRSQNPVSGLRLDLRLNSAGDLERELLEFLVRGVAGQRGAEKVEPFSEPSRLDIRLRIAQRLGLDARLGFRALLHDGLDLSDPASEDLVAGAQLEERIERVTRSGEVTPLQVLERLMLEP
jgi:hypothetical protein